MSIVPINLDCNEISRAEKLLAGITGGFEKAAKSATSRAASHIRSQSAAAIREKYDISVNDIRTNENVRLRYDGNGLLAAVDFKGHKIPLYRYGQTSPKYPKYDTKRVNVLINGQWLRLNPGIEASAHQLKSTAPKQLTNTFIAMMKSGHIGIFERVTNDKANNRKIKELMGSAVPQMLGSKEVEKRLAEGAAEVFNKRLEHETLRILNGWGAR